MHQEEAREKAAVYYFAAVGDVHGHMWRMVSLVEGWRKRTGKPLAFVLQVGDFEPHRHAADVATMSAPARYKQLGDFPTFHTGGARFPWPVYFIGGNHEPHGFLESAPEGLTVAPGCHYLGRVGRVAPKGLSIAGLSGIYREEFFTKPRPRFESSCSLKDFVYFNEQDVELALTFGPTDVLLAHEWPSGLLTGDTEGTAAVGRRMPHPEAVGNPYTRLVVEALQPRLLLCGHMHRALRTRIVHPSRKVTDVVCLDEVTSGPDALAVFRVSPEGVHEVTR